MEQNQNSSLFSLNLDAQNSYTLRNMASWAKVLGVCSIIIAGLLIIFGIVFQQKVNSSGYGYRSSGFGGDTFGNAGLIIYVIMGLIYGLGGIFAMNAGNKINAGLRTNSMETLNSGFAGARNFFALWAVLVIIGLLFMLIGLLGILST